jgi:hypothetical protein
MSITTRCQFVLSVLHFQRHRLCLASRRTEESIGLVRIVELERRDLASDDLAKNAVGVGLGGHFEQSTSGSEGGNDGQRVWGSSVALRLYVVGGKVGKVGHEQTHGRWSGNGFQSVDFSPDMGPGVGPCRENVEESRTHDIDFPKCVKTVENSKSRDLPAPGCSGDTRVEAV